MRRREAGRGKLVAAMGEEGRRWRDRTLEWGRSQARAALGRRRRRGEKEELGRWRRMGRGRSTAQPPWTRIEEEEEGVAGATGIEDDEGGKEGKQADRSTALIPLLLSHIS